MPDITLKQIKEMCAKSDMNCCKCKIGKKITPVDKYCPLVANDPADWDLEEIEKRMKQ